MKRIITIVALLIVTASLSAQNFQRRGFSLGADRDTMLYIIASPFDNWFITFGGGVQTFIGNELDASARRNKLDYNLRVEIGKWIIPDVAVSLRLSHYSVQGQSRYGLQPFIDFTNAPIANGYYEYQPFRANAFALVGFVTFDWTNFLSGYEKGKRNRLHVFSPIGLGMSMLYGRQVNPRSSDIHPQGSFRRNWEYFFDAGIGLEFVLSKNINIFAEAELFASESTWDWSPYDNAYSIFDLIPSVTGGVKFNLLKNVTKYNPYTRSSSRERVNHEFLSYGTRRTIPTLTGRIESLNSRIDSIQNLTDTLRIQNAAVVDALQNEVDSLQQELDSAQIYGGGYGPRNIMEELLGINEYLNLPATIIYYQLDKYDIDYNGRKKLQRFAKEVNAIDDTVEYYIVGAADSITGTIRHNQWLSERRCEAAYNMQVDQFDASGNQFILVPVGGIMEYEPQENNRSALIIQRTPVTEEIVNRWMFHKGKK